GSDQVHTYTISNNDNPPVVDFNTTSSNGAESVSSKAITVDLSAASGQAVTVNYVITGTATASGTDFTLANGTLTIAAGQTTGTITIASIVDDSLDEANETVILTLSNPGNATLGSDQVHTYTITDNDIPNINYTSISSSGLESVSSANLTVALSSTSSSNITVNYAVTGTATGSGTDYVLANGTLTIAAGQTTGTITIASIVDDSTDEVDETVIVTLSSPSNATLGNDSVHTYYIVDNDDTTNPLITVTSPIDNAINVAITTDIELTFNEDVDVETGTITIKKKIDNTTVEAIDVTGNLVTGTGTNTIIVNPTDDLEYETEYYILIENTAFDDEDGNSFDGISVTTIFNFTTITRLVDPTSIKDVVAIEKAMTDISTRWGYNNIDVANKRLNWLERNKNIRNKSYQGIKVKLNNKLLNTIINNLPDDKKLTTEDVKKILANDFNSLLETDEECRDKNDEGINTSVYLEDQSCEDNHTSDNESVLGKISTTTETLIIDEAIKIKEDLLGDLNSRFMPTLGNWSTWTSGEISIGLVKSTTAESKQNSTSKGIHLGADKLLENKKGIYGFAIGFGEDESIVGDSGSSVKSDNYSLFTYGTYDNEDIKFPFVDKTRFDAVFGIAHNKFDTIRIDNEGDKLTGKRDSNQIFASIGIRGSIKDEIIVNEKKHIIVPNKWNFSPYTKLDMSYTIFEKYIETGAVTALTYEERILQKARLSFGTDISYLKEIRGKNVIPFVKIEYSYDYSNNPLADLYYTSEGTADTYHLRLEGVEKEQRWKLGFGTEIFNTNSEIGKDATMVLGYRREGGFGSNFVSSESIYFDFDWDF
ncbi:MAG: hypothetical protein ACI9JG_001210, partial [Alphaproteobacteria bacterium]